MDTKKLLCSIGPGITSALEAVDPKEIEDAVEAIYQADRVFTAGWGRAGNVVRILGMDLSQLGKVVYCVGDNSTPSIQKDDILIVNSGSGNTGTIEVIARKAKKYGAKVILITGSTDPENSLIGKYTDLFIRIPLRKDLPEGYEKLVNMLFGSPSTDRGFGSKPDFGFSEEVREQITMDKYFQLYEIGFILNEVIMQKYMERAGRSFEDISYYHNNLEWSTTHPLK